MTTKQGYGIHVTFDVHDAESREEALNRVMDALPEIPGVKVSSVHVGGYVITSIADQYKDAL